jgi:hypothetical protein
MMQIKNCSHLECKIYRNGVEIVTCENAFDGMYGYDDHLSKGYVRKTERKQDRGGERGDQELGKRKTGGR